METKETKFLDLNIVAGYGYEVDPQIAEDLGAFREDAIPFDEIKEATQDEA